MGGAGFAKEPESPLPELPRTARDDLRKTIALLTPPNWQSRRHPANLPALPALLFRLAIVRGRQPQKTTPAGQFQYQRPRFARVKTIGGTNPRKPPSSAATGPNRTKSEEPKEKE